MSCTAKVDRFCQTSTERERIYYNWRPRLTKDDFPVLSEWFPSDPELEVEDPLIKRDSDGNWWTSVFVLAPTANVDDVFTLKNRITAQQGSILEWVAEFKII